MAVSDAGLNFDDTLAALRETLTHSREAMDSLPDQVKGALLDDYNVISQALRDVEGRLRRLKAQLEDQRKPSPFDLWARLQRLFKTRPKVKALEAALAMLIDSTSRFEEGVRVSQQAQGIEKARLEAMRATRDLQNALDSEDDIQIHSSNARQQLFVPNFLPLGRSVSQGQLRSTNETSNKAVEKYFGCVSGSPPPAGLSPPPIFASDLKPPFATSSPNLETELESSVIHDQDRNGHTSPNRPDFRQRGSRSPSRSGKPPFIDQPIDGLAHDTLSLGQQWPLPINLSGSQASANRTGHRPGPSLTAFYNRRSSYGSTGSTHPPGMARRHSDSSGYASSYTASVYPHSNSTGEHSSSKRGYVGSLNASSLGRQSTSGLSQGSEQYPSASSADLQLPPDAHGIDPPHAESSHSPPPLGGHRPHRRQADGVDDTVWGPPEDYDDIYMP